MYRSIETRDGKVKHKTAKCTLVSKQNWGSLYGDKKNAKEKIFALANSASHATESHIDLLRYAAIVQQPQKVESPQKDGKLLESLQIPITNPLQALQIPDASLPQSQHNSIANPPQLQQIQGLNNQNQEVISRISNPDPLSQTQQLESYSNISIGSSFVGKVNFFT